MVGTICAENTIRDGKRSEPQSTISGGAKGGKVVGTDQRGIRLLVCGSRTFKDFDMMYDAIAGFIKQHGPDVIIEGGAQGADKMAHAIAVARGVPTETYRAEWSKYGKSAGYIRNKKMLYEGKPTHGMAFFNKVKTNGTANMIDLLNDAGIPVSIFGLED